MKTSKFRVDGSEFSVRLYAECRASNVKRQTRFLFLFVIALAGLPVLALNGSYLGGSAGLTRTSDNVIEYGTATGTYAGFTANGEAGVLDWSTLSVPGGTTLEFNGGTFYNVVSTGASEIYGSLVGTGANVFIFNPNGFLFAGGSSVNVSGVFGAFATGVTGGDLDDWIANPASIPAFDEADMYGDISVEAGASISAAQIAFAAVNVAIDSTGTDKTVLGGATVLAAGDRVTIDGFGSGVITLTIPDSASMGDINMLGEFTENIEAKAAGDVTVANGEMTVGGDLDVSTNGDTDFTEGDFIVNNAELMVAGKATAQVAGDVWIQGASSLEATDVTLDAKNGAIVVAGSLDESAQIKANAGDVNIAAQDGVLVADRSVIAALNGGDETKGNVSITAKDADPLTDSTIEITGADSRIETEGNLGITGNGGDISIDKASVNVGGNLNALTEGGSIIESDDASLSVNGSATFTAGQGDVSLTGTGNDFSKNGDGLVNATGKNVDIVEKGDISLGDITATDGNVNVTDNGGTITAKGGINSSNDINIDAAKDVIADGADVNADGNVGITAVNVNIQGLSKVNGGTGVTIDADERIFIEKSSQVDSAHGQVVLTARQVIDENVEQEEHDNPPPFVIPLENHRRRLHGRIELSEVQKLDFNGFGFDGYALKYLIDNFNYAFPFGFGANLFAPDGLSNEETAPAFAIPANMMDKKAEMPDMESIEK